uniref:Uncharacterized protein ycf23 n=1 Tax=Lophocladia kuetzingii TaxID=675577 RepID=A0A1Z1MP89_9FLOR|nr:hypothetical protein [Lophocladia kuetzingii]ARW67595.1 hypothetical protein [Lophocladia kuetzingii]
MHLFNHKLCGAFYSRQVIKVIAGLSNSNINKVLRIAKAAELSQATYIDIIANPYLVKLLKSTSNLLVCASSLNAIDLYNCMVAGADLIEIGNFDNLYNRNIYLSKSEIIDLAQQTKHLCGNIDISVTIPYYLPLHEQVELSKKLESLGINILQTEALFIKNKHISHKLKVTDTIFSSVNSSSLSLLSTRLIANAVQIPIITSSGINSLSSSLPIFYGAHGIGIGSAISQKNSVYDMSNYIDNIYKSLISMKCVNSLQLQDTNLSIF